MNSVRAFILSLLLETLALFLYSYAKFHGLWFEIAALGLSFVFAVVMVVVGAFICAGIDIGINTETFNARRVRKDICK